MATFSLTVSQWRLLRRLAPHRAEGGPQTADELRSTARRGEHVRRLDLLERYGLIRPRPDGRWELTEAGLRAAGSGEYELEVEQIRAIKAALNQGAGV